MVQTDTGTRLLRLVNGYQFTQVIYVVAKLGVADLLQSGPMHIDELAKATETHAPSLYRLLRALAGHGIFIEYPNRYFDLTPLANCLQQDSPGSVRDIAILRGDDYYRTWGDLLYSVTTGIPSFQRVFGMSNWEYRQLNANANAQFNSFVAEMARRRAISVLSTYSFPEDGVAVDVGGGNGTLLMSILNRYPRLQGILFDMPQVIKDAQIEIKKSGVGERCVAMSGDFFNEVPSGGTFYILSAVLHDWEDDRAATILRRCKDSMNGAPLFIIERILPERNQPSSALLSDLDMLVNTGGYERDEASWRSLLESAGFQLESIAPTASDFYVLRASPRPTT